MKNAIEYYYDIQIFKIHQNKKNYYFNYLNDNYIFIEIYDISNIDALYYLSIYLYNNRMSHLIITTKNNNKYVQINEKYYVLLKLCCDKRKISYADIFNLNSLMFYKNNVLRHDEWGIMWENKIDNFEYQLSQNGKKYPIIRESFAYFAGLSENAIQLFNMVDKDKTSIFLSHRRIKYDTTTIELYNPLNYILDYRVRDVCEYFKSCFFKGINIYNDIEAYLYYNNLNKEESYLFFSRLLFPSYYFDIYEKVLSGEVDEFEIKKILDKMQDFENVLKKVYYLLKQNNKLPIIEWLN